MSAKQHPKYLAIKFDGDIEELSEVIDVAKATKKKLLRFNKDNTVSAKYCNKWFNGIICVFGDSKDDVEKMLQDYEKNSKIGNLNTDPITNESLQREADENQSSDVDFFGRKRPQTPLIGEAEVVTENLEQCKDNSSQVYPKYLVVKYDNTNEVSEVIRSSWAIKKKLLRFISSNSVETKHKGEFFKGTVLVSGDSKAEVKKKLIQATEDLSEKIEKPTSHSENESSNSTNSFAKSHEDEKPPDTASLNESVVRKIVMVDGKKKTLREVRKGLSDHIFLESVPNSPEAPKVQTKFTEGSTYEATVTEKVPKDDFRDKETKFSNDNMDKATITKKAAKDDVQERETDFPEGTTDDATGTEKNTKDDFCEKETELSVGTTEDATSTKKGTKEDFCERETELSNGASVDAMVAENGAKNDCGENETEFIKETNDEAVDAEVNKGDIVEDAFHLYDATEAEKGTVESNDENSCSNGNNTFSKEHDDDHSLSNTLVTSKVDSESTSGSSLYEEEVHEVAIKMPEDGDTTDPELDPFDQLFNSPSFEHPNVETPTTHRLNTTPSGSKARKVLNLGNFKPLDKSSFKVFALCGKENIDPKIVEQKTVTVQLERWVGLQFEDGSFSSALDNKELSKQLIDCCNNFDGEIFLTLSDNRIGQVIAQASSKKDCLRKIRISQERYETQGKIQDRLSYLEEENDNDQKIESTRIKERLPLSELPISPTSSPFKGLTQEEMDMVMNSSIDVLDDQTGFIQSSASSENKSESGDAKEGESISSLSLKENKINHHGPRTKKCNVYPGTILPKRVKVLTANESPLDAIDESDFLASKEPESDVSKEENTVGGIALNELIDNPALATSPPCANRKVLPAEIEEDLLWNSREESGNKKDHKFFSDSINENFGINATPSQSQDTDLSSSETAEEVFTNNEESKTEDRNESDKD